jgi:hypothetical protein
MADQLKKRATAFRSFPTDSRPWNAEAEAEVASVEDLQIMCGWWDEPYPDQRKSYQFLHHRARGHGLSWAGVQEAMGAVLGGGGQIPASDRRPVYEHLARHYREDFGKEPPGFVEPGGVPELADLADLAKAEDPPNLCRSLAELETFLARG